MNDRNLYAPPTANVDHVQPATAMSAPLWNPNAAACWSLLFTPVFGAMLHMKNWQAMGDEERARSAKGWAIGSLVYMVVVTLLGVVLPESKALDALGRVGGFALLITWYYQNAKFQQSYVLAKFGPEYPRRGWSKPLLLALLAFAAYLGAVFVILLLSGMAVGH